MALASSALLFTKNDLLGGRACRCLEWNLLIAVGVIVDVSEFRQIFREWADQLYTGGRQRKKRQHYSIDNLRPGRAPLGLLNTVHLESKSEDSDQERPPKTSLTAERQRSIQAELLGSTKVLVKHIFGHFEYLLTASSP